MHVQLHGVLGGGDQRVLALQQPRQHFGVLGLEGCLRLLLPETVDQVLAIGVEALLELLVEEAPLEIARRLHAACDLVRRRSGGAFLGGLEQVIASGEERGRHVLLSDQVGRVAELGWDGSHRLRVRARVRLIEVSCVLRPYPQRRRDELRGWTVQRRSTGDDLRSLNAAQSGHFLTFRRKADTWPVFWRLSGVGRLSLVLARMYSLTVDRDLEVGLPALFRVDDGLLLQTGSCRLSLQVRIPSGADTALVQTESLRDVLSGVAQSFASSRANPETDSAVDVGLE